MSAWWTRISISWLWTSRREAGADDEVFDYRIYRLDAPMQPGEARSISFRTRREQVGFRASGTEAELAPNGTRLKGIALTPLIGMSYNG
jgi:hypothetical protein